MNSLGSSLLFLETFAERFWIEEFLVYSYLLCYNYWSSTVNCIHANIDLKMFVTICEISLFIISSVLGVCYYITHYVNDSSKRNQQLHSLSVLLFLEQFLCFADRIHEQQCFSQTSLWVSLLREMHHYALENSLIRWYSSKHELPNILILWPPNF